MIGIILFLSMFSLGYSKNLKLNISSKINNYFDNGIGDQREFLIELLKVKLDIKGSISRASLDVVVDYKEPNPRPTYSRFQFYVNPYLDFNYGFLKVGVSSYVDDTYYRINNRDFLLSISNYGTQLNIFLFLEPNISFVFNDCVFLISSVTGFQKTNANDLKMIVYKLGINVDTHFKKFINCSFKLSLGKTESFQTVKPFNINDSIDFLDAFRIKSRISSEDIFNIKARQILNISKQKNVLDILIKEEIYYIRTQDSIHMCTLVAGIGLMSQSKIFELNYIFSLQMDVVHYMHTQENKIWFISSFEFLFPFSF